MYTRSYQQNDGALPEDYCGTSMTGKQNNDTPCGGAPCGAEPRGGFLSGIFEKLPFLNFRESLLPLGEKAKKIGIEEHLIIAAAALLFFSEGGDKECAIILILLLFVT